MDERQTARKHVGRVSVDFLTPLREEIEGPLAEMRITLRAIEDESYTARRNDPTPGGAVPLVLETMPDRSAIEQRALRHAFLAIVRAFVDFVDTLAGLKQLLAGEIRLTQDISGLDEFQAFFREIRDEQTQKISQDQSLSAYKKVRMIAALPEEQDRIVTGYFKTRRALEHHKAIPKEDIYLSAYSARIEVEGKNVIDSLPFHVEAGQQVQAEIIEQGRILPAGQEIVLSELEVSFIANSILLWIVPTLINGLKSDPSSPLGQSEARGSN